MNIHIIEGRICNDIELKTSAAGKEYTNFTVATDRDRKDSDGNKKSDFHHVSVFGKSAVFCQTYFKKGDGILLLGRTEYDKYTDKDGIERVGGTFMTDKVWFPVGKSKGGQSDTGQTATPLTGNDKDLPF